MRAIPVMVRIPPSGQVHPRMPWPRLILVQSLYYNVSHGQFHNWAQFPNFQFHYDFFNLGHKFTRPKKPQISALIGVGCDGKLLR